MKTKKYVFILGVFLLITQNMYSQSEIGESISLLNQTKTRPGEGYQWSIFNMGGSYGNSLQFWNYDRTGCPGGMCAPRLILLDNGNIGIGTHQPDYKLDVVGTIRSHEILVNTQKGADFVFEENYSLRPLSEVEAFITTNKHLPEIEPAQKMEQEGLNVSEFQIKLLQKIEELTLYLIEQEKKNETLKTTSEKQIKELELRIKELEKSSSAK